MRRFFGGRQPLCGSGVTSSILPILTPVLAIVLTTACAPAPGVFMPTPPGARILTWTWVIPFSLRLLTTLIAACMAA